MKYTHRITYTDPNGKKCRSGLMPKKNAVKMIEFYYASGMTDVEMYEDDCEGGR